MKQELKFRGYNNIVGRYQDFVLEDIEKLAGKIQWQNLTIVQFTGLVDKNKKEIFEGDICRINFDIDKVEDHLYLSLKEHEVKTGTKLFVVESPLFNTQIEFTADDIEVIGNIFENPKLVNEAN